MYKFLLFFTSLYIYSQPPVLKVSSDDNVLLENVLIYSENKFLGMTDVNGQISLNENFRILKFVKENYEDVEFSIEEVRKLNWKIKLFPIKLIELDEIELIQSKEDPNIILNKIKESRYKQRSKVPAFYQSNVLFKCNDEVLYHFNNVFFISDELKIHKKDNIIYKGNRKTNFNNNLLEVFKFSNKECQIPVQSSIYCTLGEYVLSPIFDGKLYKYQLMIIENSYLLKFYPKKDNSNLLYEGYFIVDKNDFGILELNLNLVTSKNNIWKTNSYDLKTKYEYLVIEDSFMFKFSKNNNQYFLESSSRNYSCTQIKGNHIGQNFKFSFYNEETINHSGLDFTGFDFINNKFKL